MTGIFDGLGVNRDLLLLILTILVVVLSVIVTLLLINTKKIFERYKEFMCGKRGESLEDTVLELKAKLYSVQDIQMEHRDRIKKIQNSSLGAFNKSGIVKYNAFEGMGGHTSFALALLDSNNSGIILNAMHSRTSCYLYIKDVKNGVADSALGKEEEDVLKIAMNK